MKTPFQSNAEESSNESHLLIQRSSGYLKIRWDFLREVLGVADILCHFSRAEVSIKISKSQQSIKKNTIDPKVNGKRTPKGCSKPVTLSQKSLQSFTEIL